MDAYVSVDASCCCTVTQSRPTLRNLMNCNKPGFSVLHYLLEFSQTQVHWLSDAIQPSYPLSSPSPPAFKLSQHQGLFQWVDPSHQVAKYWSFSFSISPSNEYLGLISFRMDWLDLLAVQGTLKSLLQHHSSKASVLSCSVFFMVQLSYPYMTTGKIIGLTIRIIVGKVMFLLFNILSRFVITFLLRSKDTSWVKAKGKIQGEKDESLQGACLLMRAVNKPIIRKTDCFLVAMGWVSA